MQGRQQTRHAKILEIAVHNLRTTLDSSLDAVMLVNRGGQIVGANQSCHRILGEMALESRPSLTSFLRNPGDPSQPVHFAALIPGERRRIEALRENGTPFPAEISLASARTGDGHDVSVVFLRDISDQVTYEEGLAAARHAAEAADEAKARFLAVMSHEMRTPLNGLLSATDLLDRSSPLTSEQRWFIDIIHDCGTTALEQVNNLLHLTRMGSAEAGSFPAAAVSLPQTLLAMAQQFSADAARQGTAITVTGDLKPDFAVSIQLQPLRRALSNLLSNAVKFTEDGTITLRLERFASDRPGHIGLRIAVEDTGIGIAEENLDRIFRNFETLDSSFARVHEGSGLGLGIAKLSAEALNGRIEAHSRLGEGSRFTLAFEAPLADLPAREPAETGPDSLHLKGYSVLLAEDNAINRALMRRQLEGLGLQVTEAADGIEAVERAQAQDFDVILMDVSMPRMDGLAATGLIRRGQRQPEVPIIAVTAQASPERVQQFRAAQLNDVLTKPARVEELAAMILRFCAPRRGPAGSDPAPDYIEPDLLTPLAQDEILAQLRADMEPAFLAGMVRQFREDGHASIAATAAALKAGDLARVQALSHRFAGGAAVLGLLALRNALCDQEDAARDGQSQRAEQLQAAIPPLFTRSLAHLDRALGVARA
nr:response regulator [Tabrizicola soli]